MLPRNNAPYLVGLAVLVLVFLGAGLSTGSIALGLILGFGLGLAAVFIVHGLFPTSPELEEYRLDTRRRVKKVLDAVERIRKLTKQVDALEPRQALESGCKTILDLMHLVQQKNANSIPLTAARIYNYLLEVERITSQYLEVVRSPSYFDNAQQLIRLGEQAFGNFHDFALSRIREVNNGELIAYQASLESIEPLPELR